MTRLHGINIPIHVVFDCADPSVVARFWADALGYQLQGPPEPTAAWQAWLTENGVPEERWNDASAIVDPDGHGPRIYFQRVPEPKAVKNRLHLDVNAGGPPGMPPSDRRARVDEMAELKPGRDGPQSTSGTPKLAPIKLRSIPARAGCHVLPPPRPGLSRTGTPSAVSYAENRDQASEAGRSKPQRRHEGCQGPQGTPVGVAHPARPSANQSCRDAAGTSPR